MIGGLIALNVFIAGAAVALGLFLLFSQGRDRQRLLFSLLSITTAVWVIANFFGDANSYPLVIADYVSGAALGLLFWLFSRATMVKAISSARAKRSEGGVVVLAVYGAVAINVALIVTGLIVYLGYDPAHDARLVQNGPLYLVYPLTIFTFAASSIFFLLRGYFKARDSLQKTRVRLMLFGLIVAFVCIVVPNLILQNILPRNSIILIMSYDGAYIGILAFLAMSAYAIVRHGLFDVKLAAVRSAAYICSLLTMSFVYYILAYALSMFVLGGHTTTVVSVSPVNIMLALVSAFLFQPIKQFFDRVTNNIFYRESYKSDEFFAELSNLLTSTVDLRGLLERSSAEMATTFKMEQAFYYIYYTNNIEHHMSAGTHGHAKMPLYDARMLDAYVTGVPYKVIVTEMLPDDASVKRMLRSHRIAIVMPLRQSEKIVGYVMMGDRLSGNYTKRDLNVLSTISSELVIAIQNAISLHEVKELNATLQQRIDVATKELRSSNAQLKRLDEVKDEFMSMASHQLRTPLTSIKGYISMVLEGDVGKVSPQQDRLLQEAFNSSERMVRLINDFLNVSRLQTGKFNIDKAPVDIKAVVRQEIETLQLMAATRGIKLRLNVTSEQLPLMADESKIRQVVMNFVDNAIYYSKSDSTIIINLERLRSEVALTVVDTGIGVPEDEQSKLFTKFFRAKNARQQRPDGTGVGLYLARRVISGHGGTIIFSSKEGKGSTFGFKLPLSEKLGEKPVEHPAKITAR